MFKVLYYVTDSVYEIDKGHDMNNKKTINRVRI